jgi:hypothetical protein
LQTSTFHFFLRSRYNESNSGYRPEEDRHSCNHQFHLPVLKPHSPLSSAKLPKLSPKFVSLRSRIELQELRRFLKFVTEMCSMDLDEKEPEEAEAKVPGQDLHPGHSESPLFDFDY